MKSFEQYINETQQSIVHWNDLSAVIKSDIMANVYDTNAYLQKNYWDVSSLIDAIEASDIQPTFKVELKDVSKLYAEFVRSNHQISKINLEKVTKAIQLNGSINPIILRNGKFFDGGHRLVAFYNLGKSQIPTIDIGKLLNLNWKKWDNNEIDF